MNETDKKIMSEDELLKAQRKGAKVTASIIALIAFAVFSFTIYMKFKG